MTKQHGVVSFSLSSGRIVSQTYAILYISCKLENFIYREFLKPFIRHISLNISNYFFIVTRFYPHGA